MTKYTSDDDGDASPTMSPAEYLVRERAARCRSEYVGGEVRALAGASRRHNQIVTNIVAAMAPRLLPSGCFVYANDMRVQVRRHELYFYPDVVIVCGKPEFLDDEEDTLLNPTIVFEVLSRATAAFDRGKKFEYYRSSPTLQEYVLASQDEPLIERLSRVGAGDWVRSEYRGIKATARLEAIGADLTLARIYAHVFDAEAS